MKHRFTSIASCAALVAAFGSIALLSASAQQVSAHSAPSAQPVYLASAATPGTDAVSSNAGSSTTESSASESSSAAEAAVPDSPNQPPPRPRYSRPRYHDSGSNSDGSNKYAFEVGGGLTLPEGTNSNYLTPSYGIQLGGGRNFSQRLGLMLQFDYDEFGMTAQTISTQSYIYTGSYTNGDGIDANSHIWSFSVDPIFNIRTGEGLGAYVTGGVGFYHKVANFTSPQEEEYCSYYYGCVEYPANVNFDHYTSNAPGFNGGFGVTYKMSRFSSAKLFGEVRYVFVDNQAKPGVTVATATTYTGNNYFPQNSNHTSYFPVKFGIRF